MELKLGRFGKYFACQSDSCTATRQLMKNGELKPVFMDPINLRVCDAKSAMIFIYFATA